MLNRQKTYMDYLDEVSSLLSTINIDTDKSHALKEEISQSELIVPVVGAFSAGKSTLINSFLEGDILSTNITPETALATELRYALSDYIEAVKEDGSVDKYTLEQNDEIKAKAKEYQYLRLYLNSDKLKQIEPLILVDMPGFDSPVDLHNQAILNYLKRGVYFVVLTSIEDGGVSKSMMRELANIIEFGKGFSFCLSKTNLRPHSAVEDVKNRMKEQLDDAFDIGADVITVDDNGGENIKKILHAIDVESLFKNLYIDILKSNHYALESSMDVKVSTLKHSKKESVEAMEELRAGVEKINRKKEQLILDIENRYSGQAVESIVTSVANELRKNKDTLVSFALSDSQNFSREVNEIVKHKLIYEIKTKMEMISTEIVNDFTIELKEISGNVGDFSLDEEWIEKISENTKMLLASAQKGLGKLGDMLKGKEGAAYKTIGTILGLTTAVLNPILELIIVFLPDIISFFGAQSKEEKARTEMLNKFESEIIPSLKTQLRSALPSIFDEQLRVLIDSISNEFEEQLKTKEEEIASAMEEKEHTVAKAEDEIGKIEEIKKQIQVLTTNTLFKEDK